MPQSLTQRDPVLDPSLARSLRRALLAWYRRHHRRLPWRARPGRLAPPYRVLVSEAMLQQTQVPTVVDYFQRFVARWPSVEALAAAGEQDVLRLWQGLGYYRRARLLHAAARQIVDQHAGRVPDTVDTLVQLPGVGRYTAGAVASIAFGRGEPAVDGNVKRVLARWFAIAEPADEPATAARLWALARALLPAEHPGDFNQALMELGAVICSPRKPDCPQCPVTRWCRARIAGDPQRLPVTPARPAPRRVEHHVVAVARAKRFLFQQRPDRGLWSNMWQLPTVQDLPARAGGATVRRWAREELGLTLSPPRPLGGFIHQTTHRTIRFVVWTGRVTSGRLRRGAGQWRRLDAVDDLPLANPQRRAVVMVANDNAPGDPGG